MKTLLLCATIFFVLTGQRLTAQQTLLVPSATYATIQSALNAAANGDTVLVGPGTYVENLMWPPLLVHLIGAGPTQSIIDGNQTGSCISITADVSDGSSIEGFKITNGSGTLDVFGFGYVGGGMYIQRTVFLANPSPYLSITVKDCDITGNSAVHAGGFLVRFAEAIFERCTFSNNSTVVGGDGSCGLVGAQPGSNMVFKDCEFSQHSGKSVLEFPTGWNPSVTVEDCYFHDNTADVILAVFGGQMTFRRNRFTNNTTAGLIMSATQSTGSPFVIDSCLFADNATANRILRTAAGQNLTNTLVLSNNTIVRNTSTLPSIQLFGGNTLITDCIVKGNVDDSGSLFTNPFDLYFANSGNNLVTWQNSNIQGQANLGPGVIDVIAMFVAGQSGDFRLRPGSPMIDAGTLNPTFTQGAGDVRDWPRIRNGRVDMGAYEAQSLAHHPASAGTVGAAAGGPYDILKMNGTSGGIMRHLEVAIGTSSTLEMDQPPHLIGPLQFSIFGIIGEANFDSVINVPLGIGDMMFAPAPMIPFLHPSFFTLASSVGQLGFYAPLFSATPTPWNSGFGPAIPFPLKITIQGIIEEAPGVFAPTNALIFEVK